MTIQIKNTVINTDRFIYATIGATGIQVWMEGLPTTRQFVIIPAKDQKEAQEIIAEINKKMQKTIDRPSNL